MLFVLLVYTFHGYLGFFDLVEELCFGIVLRAGMLVWSLSLSSFIFGDLIEVRFAIFGLVLGCMLHSLFSLCFFVVCHALICRIKAWFCYGLDCCYRCPCFTFKCCVWGVIVVCCMVFWFDRILCFFLACLMLSLFINNIVGFSKKVIKIVHFNELVICVW